MANANQYFLLADHIKLSLLERQRAVSLNLEPTSQDGHISRSLDSLRDGLESISKERIRLQEAGDTACASPTDGHKIKADERPERQLRSQTQSRICKRNTTTWRHSSTADPQTQQPPLSGIPTTHHSQPTLLARPNAQMQCPPH